MLEARQHFTNLPRTLRETLEKGRPQWEEVVRRTRWGAVPIHIVGSGVSFAAGLAGALAFESLLGWPAVVRTPEEFLAYSQLNLRPRSILILISWPGSDDWSELVRGAKARGATVLALTRDAQSPLAKAVDGVFLVRGGGEARDDCAAAVCQLTAIHGLSVVMAQVLSRPSPRIEVLQGELRALPEHIAWVLRQLPDALRTLSGELSGLQEVSMLAGGFYYPAALMGANVLRGMGARRVRVFTPDEMDACFPESFERGEVVVVLSGSRCRVKKRLHGIIERLNRGQVKILAVTDQSEPEVARRAALAVLLPNLTENIGSIVGLALLLAAASQQASAGKGHARRSAGV